SSGAGGTTDGDGSHGSTSKTPSYTKSVSWHHYRIAAPYAVAVLLSSYGVTGVFILLGAVSIIVAIAIATIGIETKGVSVESLSIDAVANK
ncbi:hypothetical protein ACP8Y5_24040, partial [Escherichia coli]